MARSISSQKRLRQNKTRAARNQARKTIIKASIRNTRDALAGKDAAKAQAAFIETVAVLDRAANKKTIHRNTAARRKSRLAKRLNALKSAKK
ncbi:MAG: 30S ribosomal protein S20 [Planctomycetes bacterium]|nr:30S ribosomal protein S20 [Planctomycetota bacterium]